MTITTPDRMTISTTDEVIKAIEYKLSRLDKGFKHYTIDLKGKFEDQIVADITTQYLEAGWKEVVVEYDNLAHFTYIKLSVE